MKILVINSGSSSIKFTLFQMDTNVEMAKGVVERIGLSGTHLFYETMNGISIEKIIKDCYDLAPLHNPPNLNGIRACRDWRKFTSDQRNGLPWFGKLRNRY